jgi:hypothetical protein
MRFGRIYKPYIRRVLGEIVEGKFSTVGALTDRFDSRGKPTVAELESWYVYHYVTRFSLMPESPKTAAAFAEAVRQALKKFRETPIADSYTMLYNTYSEFRDRFPNI